MNMPSLSKIWKALTTPITVQQTNEQKDQDTEDDVGAFRNQWLTVHIAFATLREFQECDSYHQMQKNAENLRNIVDDIKRLAKLPNYPSILKKGASEFRKNWKTKIIPDELERIEFPDKIDVDGMIHAKYIALSSNYRNYWENAISRLVRKSAILNRRQYLLEDIDRFIASLPVKYPEVVQELENYKAFNLEKIESPE